MDQPISDEMWDANTGLREGEEILKSDVKLPQDAKFAVEDIKLSMKELEDTAKSCDDDSVEYELDKLQADILKVSGVELSKIFVSEKNSTGSTSTPNAGSKANLTQFEKMKLPKFDGTVRGYIAFKRKFTRWIYKNCDEEVALMRLVDACVVENSPEWHLIKNKKSEPEAFKVLDQRFGRKQSIRDAILQNIKAIPTVKRLSDSKG